MLPSFYSAIGSDRYLDKREIPREAGSSRSALEAAWTLYKRAFEGFCGTGLDPLFHRLTHPAVSSGTLALDPADPVVIVGTGPSLARGLPTLVRLRERLRLFTSPRGAERLAEHHVTPDLVLVEHRTVLDAHHSARHAHDEVSAGLRHVPLVAADWRTPRALLQGLSPTQLFVPEPLPTWGLWPATLAALAVNGGARTIALLGIDLGTIDRPDPSLASLRDLLGLIARIAAVGTFDCGLGGARKPGWLLLGLPNLAAIRPLAPVVVRRRPLPAAEAREAAAATLLAELAPLVGRARRILALATAARAGSIDVEALAEAAGEVQAWRHERRIRLALQDGLGVSFLPRLWRLGLSRDQGAALWRPLMLASHELVGQADRLGARLGRAAA